jgi:Ca2+-binding RTX toxin-like protein
VATAGSDWLVGTSGGNTLVGGSGFDIIRGGAGNDKIVGGADEDLLDFSDGKAGISITLSQSDTKYATFDGRKAGLGTDLYRDMEGVIGTKFGDTITGSSGDDVIVGLGGNDVLKGGKGDDLFYFERKGGKDKILDFGDSKGNQDIIDLAYLGYQVTSATFAAWKKAHVNQVGADTVIKLDGTNTITLTGVKASALGFDDFYL